MKRRRLMQPSFHRAALAEMAKTMVRFGAAFFDGLQVRSKNGEPVDIHEAMVKLTLDVVVATLFGTDLTDAAQVDPAAIGAALEVVGGKLNGVPIPDWVPTATNRRAKAKLAEVEVSIQRVIQAARARPSTEPTLLSMLLDTVDEETGERLSDRQLRDEVFTLFLAGHETTALTLAWMFVLLDGRDDVVAKLRAEAAEVLGGRDPEFADVPKLKYARQVIDETLRLRSPAAMVARSVVADDEIMGFRVKAGSTVMPYFWGVHRHPDFWSEPQKFDPTRFTEENAKGRDPWCYLPFSGGQRVCIGNTFSLVETTLLLAMIVQRFDVALLPGAPIEPVAVATVRPSRPVLARLSWR
jgi:cytochrome P450